MSNKEQQVTPLVFFQLSKIDEAKRLVHGRAVQEVPDRVGEIFDYETSKPNFQAWSASQFDASLGKSNGNVRAMHKDVAAGIVIPGGMTFNDAEKAIDMTAKIIDEDSWQKCLSGVFTGFSIGGKYAKKWEDAELKKTRYTADPSEISLVDRPCIPTATFFDIQKADGSVMQKAFAAPKEDDAAASIELSKTDPAQSAAATDAPAEGEFDIQATPEQVEEFCKLLAKGNIPFDALLGELRKEFPWQRDKPEGGKAENEGVAQDEKEAPGEKAAEVKAGEKLAEEDESKMTPEQKAKRKADLEAKAAADAKGKKAHAIEGLVKVAAELVSFAADLAKTGARNSVADQERLQKAHDALNEAGARCRKTFLFADDDVGIAASTVATDVGSNAVPAIAAAPNDKAEPTGDLAKADDLRKALDDAVTTIAKLTADVEMLKAQPLPSKVRLRAVSKGDELTNDEQKVEIAPVKDAHGEVHKAATTIKELHQSGGERLFKF